MVYHSCSQTLIFIRITWKAGSHEFLIHQVWGKAQQFTFLANSGDADADAVGSDPVLWELLVYHKVHNVLDNTGIHTCLLQIMTT